MTISGSPHRKKDMITRISIINKASTYSTVFYSTSTEVICLIFLISVCIHNVCFGFRRFIPIKHTITLRNHFVFKQCLIILYLSNTSTRQVKPPRSLFIICRLICYLHPLLDFTTYQFIPILIWYRIREILGGYIYHWNLTGILILCSNRLIKIFIFKQRAFIQRIRSFPILADQIRHMPCRLVG